MKRRFTILTAALALLTFLAVPMGMRGQTRSVTYEPATSISAGDVVLLVAEGTNYKKELSGFSTTSTIYGTVADFTTAPAGVYPLTVVAGNSSGSFAFKNSENKYLSWSSGNSLELSETLNNSSSWTFNYAYTVTTITNVGTTARQIKYNSSSPRFACYTSGQQSVKLYKQVGGSLLDNDLALTGAPVALSFDLYNNASAQTISYTTSSTGAVTVSASNYVTTSVNPTAKTITVTPTAVTPSAQTITVNQAADDNYAAGSKTFTVNITNSAPSIVIPAEDLSLSYEANDDGSFSVSFTNGFVPNAISPTFYSDAACANELPTSGDDAWIVLTTTDQNTINYSVAANSNSSNNAVERTAYLKVIATDYNNGNPLSITDVFTVTQAAPDFATLPFAWAGGLPNDFDALNGTTLNGVGSYPNQTTYQMKLDNDDDYIQVKCDQQPGKVTIGVKMVGGNTDSKITVQGSANGQTFTDVEELTISGAQNDELTLETTTAFAADDRYVRMLFTKGSNVGVGPISIALPTPAIAAEDVNIAYDAEEGTINYTINNPENDGSLVASCNAEWIVVDDTPQTTSTGSIDFTCYPNSNFYAHSATVTLTYTYGDSKATVTKDITVTQALDPDANGSSVEYPIMVSEAIDAIDEVGTISNIYVGGIVSEIVSAYNNSYITFNMIDEVGDEYSLQAYHCIGEDADEVAVGDQVVVYGNLCLYTNYNYSIYEFSAGCQLVSLIHPIVPSITVSPVLVELNADEHDGTLDLTYENLIITDMSDFAIQYYNAEGEETTKPNWIEVLVAEQDPTIGEGYVVSYYMFENEGDARTAYFKVYAMDEETNIVYSDLVTISQAAPVTGDEYALYTGALVEGDYLIVYNGGAMNTTVDSDRLQYEEVSATNNVIVTDNAAIVWHISPSGQYWTIYNADENAYAASAGAKNKAQMLADGTDDKALWTVSGTETYEFVNKKNTANNVNANLRKNGTYGFACYATSTGGALSLYKKVEPATETHTLTVTGYADYSAKDGYCLIASPVTVDPADVEGLVVANTDPNYQYFDLYSFANNQDEEWHNYKNTPFDLVPGTGYLYAKKATNEISTYSFELTGTPYSGDGEIELTQGTGNWADWNLVGNPYGVDAEIYNDCYVMNGNGSGITPAENHIVPAMHGVFVKYAEGEEVAIFEPIDGDGITSVQSENRLVLNLVRNRGTVIDRAIVRFGEGRQMTKFTLFENSTKLYIPQDDEDYAIVRSEAQGELPVSFRAGENGTYTLSMNVENVEMNYLHLIDNMTGMDIDLLQTPSYTFEANTNDYANRFKLVFAANGANEADESSFAFFSNGNLIVNNEGNATLQVIDINGRILSSETISGSCSKAINATTGVYMLRLINGDNVKVQKVVVR